MTADKYDDLAKTAGTAAGLKQEQIPGLAHILRELAKGERAAERERCARVADDRAFQWVSQNNTERSSEGHEIAAAIRARGS